MASSPCGDRQALAESPEEQDATRHGEPPDGGPLDDGPPDDEPPDDGPPGGAPRYAIPSRALAAVEMPAVVENIDRAVKAFGRVPSLTHALDPLRSSLPLFLNPESPFCPPIMSHNATSHNVVLKITVPRRTGRKRKRGTDGPWLGDIAIADADTPAPSLGDKVCSIARLDEPKLLRRRLADNVDRYQVEAVGIIKHTHRFRGLADFYWDMSKSSFARRYAGQVLPGDVQQMKSFQFEPGIDAGPNVDIIPPPLFTHMSLPFNYYYSQNPYVRNTRDGGTINTTAVKRVGYFISAEEPAPAGPRFPPDVTDPRTMEILAQLEAAFQDRPVWTRRSLMNHLGGKLRNWNELKKYLNFTAYQFKGGPWRDGVVPYGVDPRTDPKYRVYQTLMFKLTMSNDRDQTWQSLRRSRAKWNEGYGQTTSQSHMFDGESYHTDGKVWQVCDITDPLLREMLDHAAVRPTWDVNSGWYHGGLWAKVKAIMKTKLVAIRFGRHLRRTDFASTLACGDRTPTRGTSSTFHLPLPNLGLTKEELTELRGREPPKKKSSGYNVRFRPPDKRHASALMTAERSWAAGSPGKAAAGEAALGGPQDEDSASGGETDNDSDDGGYAGRAAYSDEEPAEDDDAYGDDEAEDDGIAMGSTVYPELD